MCPAPDDWARAISIFGSLPKDYVDFVKSYGSGCMGEYPLCIYAPLPEYCTLSMFPYYRDRKRYLEIRSSPSKRWTDVNFIRYAHGGGAEVFGWRAIGPADTWTTVIFSGEGGDFEEFDLSFSDLVVGLVIGSVKSRILPDDAFGDYSPSTPLEFQPP